MPTKKFYTELTLTQLNELDNDWHKLNSFLTSRLAESPLKNIVKDLEREVENHRQQLQKKASQKFILYEIQDTSIGSWNGKYSGSDQRYTFTERIEKRTYIPKKSSYHYNFGDGWSLNIIVSTISKIEAEKLKPNGFRDYEWMISSIKKHEKIIAD
jgi:hypothetical protein